jgi:HAD superfamily hydrolase (TIGR01484 family)
MLRLISTDFDGTIHDPTSIPPIAPEFVDWIRSAQGYGIKWVVNTGRDFTSLINTLKLLQLGIYPDYVVSVERQIHIFHRGEYHDHPKWNRRCHVDHEALFVIAEPSINRIRTWLETNSTAQIYSDSWSPLCIIASHESEADSIHRIAEEECRQVSNLTIVRNSAYFRFAHRSYTKGSALAEIARDLGLNKDQIFAAGDHYNDITMLDGTHATHVAAPANAIPGIKASVLNAGGYVSERTCSHGILDALEFFMKKNVRKI